MLSFQEIKLGSRKKSIINLRNFYFEILRGQKLKFPLKGRIRIKWTKTFLCVIQFFFLVMD